MSNEQSCVYVTHDHIQPIKDKLQEHAERFVTIDGWRDGADRRANSYDESLRKICSTLKSTEEQVTARQKELTIKFDNLALDNSKSEVKIDAMAKTLDAMALADATERGRKEEREKNEEEAQRERSKKAVTIAMILGMLQIIVIVTSYLKH